MGFKLSQSFMPNSYTNACNVFLNGRANKMSSSTKPWKSTDQSEQNQNHFGMVRVPNYDPIRTFLVVPLIG